MYGIQLKITRYAKREQNITHEEKTQLKPTQN